MRLLFFPGGSYIGGQETLTLALMRELKVQGHPCFAIVSGWNDGQYLAELHAADIPYRSLKLGRLYLSRPLWTLDGLINLPRATLQLREVVRNFQPDVMVLTGIEFAWTVSHVAPRSVPFVMHLHAAPSERWGKWSGRYMLRKAKGVIGVSEFVCDLLVRMTTSNLPVQTVRNVVPLTRGLLRHPSPKLRVGIVGQLMSQKRHNMLVEAIGLLDQEQRDKIEIHIYGSNITPFSNEIRQQLVRANLARHFRWMGFVSSQADIYGHLDVVVAPAVDEAFGMTVAEAGSYGLPVIAARSGGFPEIVEDGVTGLLVPPDDPKALAQALERLLDEKLRASLGERARQHIASNFTVKAMAEKFVAAIESFGAHGTN
jgi:glycosyltransferase involved in cell wall biosynthesis